MAKDDYRKGTHTIDLNTSLVKLNLDDTPPINNLDETRPIVKPTKQIVTKQSVITKATNKIESNNQKEDKTPKKTSNVTIRTSIPNTSYSSLGSYMSQRNKPTKKQEEYRNETIKFIKDNITNTRNATGNGRITYDTNKVLGTHKVTVSGLNKALRQSNNKNKRKLVMK